MTTTLSQRSFAPVTGGELPGGSDSLSVFVVFDDRSAAQRAVQLCGWLFSQLGGQTDLRPMPWSAAQLSRPELGSLALRELALAEILLVSATAPAEIVGSICELLRSSSAAAGRGLGLVVALIDEEQAPPHGQPGVLGRLQAAAEEAGLAFLSPFPSGGGAGPSAGDGPATLADGLVGRLGFEPRLKGL